MSKSKLLFFFLISALFPACQLDRQEKVDRKKFTFTIGADSYLFFKNVRQIYYDFTDLPQAHSHVYRFTDRYKGEERPMIHPTIVVDWQQDEAYLLIETNSAVEDLTIRVKEINSKNGVTYTYTLNARGRENMLEFATKVYEGIMEKNQLYLLLSETEVPLFTEADAENFRIVMADYYRLTRIF